MAATCGIWLQAAPGPDLDTAIHIIRSFNFRSVRQAVADLRDTFGKRYPKGDEYLLCLRELEMARAAVLSAWASGDGEAAERVVDLAATLEKLRAEALLANPLLDFDRLLVVKRAYKSPGLGPPRGKRYPPSPFYTQLGLRLGLPVNHYSLASVEPEIWDNEIAVLSPVRPGGKLTTLFRPPGRAYVGEIDLHWDADRLLFSMPAGGRYRVYEIRMDGSGLHQITPDDQPDVDNFDATYLPNGKIIFCGNASYQAVPCWNGLQTVSCMYSINPDGSGMRQLTFDQDEDSGPTVLNTGQVLFSRWEYANTPHAFPHLLFQMNPDGTSQREFYGSNSYWPNAIYFARPIPGEATKVIGIVSGYHGDYRMGELYLIDPARGRHGKEGMIQRIPGYGQPIRTRIKDRLTSASWPKFLHPYPLSDKYFLVSAKPSPEAAWGIYLVDIFDNMLLLREEEGYALLEPTPIRKTPRPPVVPDKVDLDRKDALVYLQDVYAGPGLKGVPRGTVKRLRLFAYHYGYRGLSGWDKIGIDGPWEVMRILGTVPVEKDGSAMFRVPANTPISVQPLDERGRAVQVMRSWFTAMPGELRSCVGCHEPQNTLPAVKATIAATNEPAEVQPWYGPARGFDFEREVQPVLDKYCVGCHNGAKGRPDLRSKEHFPDYQGQLANVPQWWSAHNPDTYQPELMRVRQRKQIRVKFTPAYEALHPYVRRYDLEGDYVLSNPGEYDANTSELIQMLEKGHHGVRLDKEAWDRLFTWIDLDVPCHGTWSDVLPIPFSGRRRRVELAKLYANLDIDPEQVPAVSCTPAKPVLPAPEPPPVRNVRCPGWPFDLHEARERQRAAGFPVEKTVDLGGGLSYRLVLVPAGEFVMGDADGPPDERPLHRVRIDKPFWMGALEVTNAQYHRFDPAHDSRYINHVNSNHETRGFPVNEPDQPVVRVTWKQAMAFCRWLSETTGQEFTLPTEAQWEWAARAGTATPFYYGYLKTNFAQWANMADASLKGFAEHARSHGFLYRIQPDWMLRIPSVNDGAMVTTRVGSYYPNAWGLYDMHGNAAEWTRSEYRSYADGSPIGEPGRKVVRGGSWYDRPHRCRSGFRWAYPAWQPVYNVGFRVISEVR